MICTANYPALDIRLSSFNPVVLCQDCGDVIENREIYSYPLAAGGELSLCASCFDYRVMIERRILSLVGDVCSPRNKIITDLEDIGIDSKRGNEALGRLLRCRRLQEGD
jgi:hypothetical protein